MTNESTSRIQLLVRLNPGGIEVFMNLKRKNGAYRRLLAVIDTGAAISLMPTSLLEELEHQVTENGTVHIEQAGIARQTFEATEAFIKLYFEDQYGGRSPELEAKVWFAETKAILIGFEGILDKAILHVDMIHTRSGWMQIIS